MRDGFHDQDEEKPVLGTNKLQLAIDDATGVIEVNYQTTIASIALDRMSPYDIGELLGNRLNNAARDLIAGMRQSR